jgi:hypothetical protein
MDAIYVARNTVFAMTTGFKTVLLVASGANQPVSIVEWGISFDGVTASAVPATVEVVQKDGTGAGTAGATPPAIVQVGGRAITAQPVASHNYTAEPTTYTTIEQYFVPQFMGVLVKQYPLGQENDTDLSGGAVRYLGIRANVSANVNCLAYMRFAIGG